MIFLILIVVLAMLATYDLLLWVAPKEPHGD